MNLLRIVCFNDQFSAKRPKSGKFSIKLCEKDSVVTCRFYSFDDKFLDNKICANSHRSVNAGLLTSKCP